MNMDLGKIDLGNIAGYLEITGITSTAYEDPEVHGYLRQHYNCKCSTSPRDPIDRVIFNNPAVIVFWKDGSKTVVKCGPDDTFDKEKGLAMAIAKKYLGNKGNYNNILKKYLKEVNQ